MSQKTSDLPPPAPLRSFAALAGAVLTSLAIVSCGGTEPIGGLTVPFKLGANVDCATVGVDQVRMTVTLIEEGDGSGITFEESGPCGAGEVTLSNLDIGTYNIIAEALDPNGLVILDNLDPGGNVQAEVLEAQTNTADSVTLLPAPAVLRLRWSLNVDGFQAMCQDVTIAKFTVETYKADGLKQLTTHTFSCDDPADSEGQHRTMPDLERALAGDEVAIVRITPKDANNKQIGDITQVCLAAPPGYGREIQVTIACDNDVCTAYESDIGPGESCTPGG